MLKKLIAEGEENGEQARDEGAIDGRGAVGRMGVGARVFLSRCTARTCARTSRVLRLGSHCRRWFVPPYKQLPCILFFSFLPSSVVRLMVHHACAVCAVRRKRVASQVQGGTRSPGRGEFITTNNNEEGEEVRAAAVRAQPQDGRQRPVEAPLPRALCAPTQPLPSSRPLLPSRVSRVVRVACVVCRVWQQRSR